MNNVKKLLDEVKRKNGVKTDYALAYLLELPTQRISDYYKGSRAPDEFACLQISQQLEKPLSKVIAAVKADTEKDEKRRLAWENYLKGMGGIAASVFVAVILIVTPTPSEAAPALKVMPVTFCIMLSIMLIRAATLTALGRHKNDVLRVYSSYSINSGIRA